MKKQLNQSIMNGERHDNAEKVEKSDEANLSSL